MNKRYEQLDSIRGIASLIVMLSHIAIIATLPLLKVVTYKYSPLKVFVNGHPSVVMFFILSGFVLTLPYLRGSNSGYASFLIKRVFRIYVPYAVAVSIAFGLIAVISPKRIDSLGDWFNGAWIQDITSSLVRSHYFLLGNYNTNVADNAIWSLVHEMRISIIFPLLAYMIIKLNWKYVISIGVALSLISGISKYLNIETSYGYNTTYSDTLHYIAMFLFGGLIAAHITELADAFNKLSMRVRAALTVLAFVTYNYSIVVNTVAYKVGLKSFDGISGDYSITIGATVFLILAFASRRATKILHNRVILFFGRISFSLYLYHLIALFALTHVFYNKIPLMSIFAMSITASIVTASIMYYIIELPAMRIGSILARRSVVLNSVALWKTVLGFTLAVLLGVLTSAMILHSTIGG